LQPANKESITIARKLNYRLYTKPRKRSLLLLSKILKDLAKRPNLRPDSDFVLGS
jgi:hypothetical protein